MPIQFGPLDDKDDRAAFSCGQPDLDDWFHRRAGQDDERNIARVFVARDEHGIVGFYSLSVFTLAADQLPEKIARKLPRYGEIPAVLLGRFARHTRMRGLGVGELLMADVIKRVLQWNHEVAIYAIVTDAKDEKLSEFYQSFGFQPLPSRPLRLFLPLATAQKASVDASG